MKGIFQLINVVEFLKLLVSKELRYKWKSYLLNTGSVMDTYLTNLSKFRGIGNLLGVYAVMGLS